MSSYKRFNLGFLLAIIILATISLPNWLVLRNAGELYSSQKMSELLVLSDHCLIGQASPRYEVIDFKLPIYEALKPQAVIFGSSRAMQMRTTYFLESTFNFSGVARNVGSLRDAIQQTLKVHRPRSMIIFIDFWWFEPNARTGNKKYILLTNRWINYLKTIFLPIDWLWTGKITVNDYARLLHQSNGCKMGMLADQRLQGFLRDGSYFYGDKYITPNSESFSDSLQKIDLGTGQYPFGQTASANELTKFLALMSDLESLGIETFVILPPVAPPIFSKMKSKSNPGYQYINDLGHQLSQRLNKFYDYHNPKLLNSNACEFIDGHHMGEITAARILKIVAESSNGLKADLEKIQAAIESYEGLTVSPLLLQQFMPNNKEIDFLDYGCEKIIGFGEGNIEDY